MKFCIVGTGFSGSVLAKELANHGNIVHVYEKKSHVAGLCFTKRNEETGINEHVYGPHIFHTDDEEVWDYICQFDDFYTYIHRVKANAGGHIYSLPVNLHTINQFFGKALTPAEAKSFINQKRDNTIKQPQNFEEQALNLMGKELYEAFFHGYTIKQWGTDPNNLPASILNRLPFRFNYNDSYSFHKYQGIPEYGYTHIVEKILDHPNIKIHSNSKFERARSKEYDHCFWTGPLDDWFRYSEGRLPYRTLDFEKKQAPGDFQGCSVMNYCDADVPYTRITEHKHFEPHKVYKDTIYYLEYSRECAENDNPYYPVRSVEGLDLLEKYVIMAQKEKNVSFLGRLGTFRYIDMDVTIKESLMASQIAHNCLKNKDTIPPFFINPCQ